MNTWIWFADIGSDLAHKAGEIGRVFGVDWPAFIAQCISFSLVALLLYRFAYKPILAVLEERRQRIAESLADAEKIKRELARAEEQARAIVSAAGQQANRLIEEARAAAAQVQAQETQRAVAAAEQIVAKAREAAAQDYSRMLAELKQEVGRLVIQTTTAVTGKVLTPEDHQRLAEETARQLSA